VIFGDGDKVALIGLHKLMQLETAGLSWNFIRLSRMKQRAGRHSRMFYHFTRKGSLPDEGECNQMRRLKGA
jgi:hypothetical protein